MLRLDVITECGNVRSSLAEVCLKIFRNFTIDTENKGEGGEQFTVYNFEVR